MKHKAQESLNYLESGFKFYSDFNTLQDLINCQLTPDEATAIFTVAGNFATVFSTLKDSGIFNEKSIEVIKSIAKDLDSGLNKLQKQKEMWVSEDETN